MGVLRAPPPFSPFPVSDRDWDTGGSRVAPSMIARKGQRKGQNAVWPDAGRDLSLLSQAQLRYCIELSGHVITRALPAKDSTLSESSLGELRNPESFLGVPIFSEALAKTCQPSWVPRVRVRGEDPGKLGKAPQLGEKQIHPTWSLGGQDTSAMASLHCSLCVQEADTYRLPMICSSLSLLFDDFLLLSRPASLNLGMQ